MWCSGKEAIIGGMPSIDVRVTDSAEDSKEIAVLVHVLQIGRCLVFFPLLLWKKTFSCGQGIETDSAAIVPLD